MANRDVGIALSGVVVGVLLGAGSILYAQGSALGADSFAFTPYELSPRKLNIDSVKKDEAKKQEKMKKAAPAATPTVADLVDAKSCAGAKAIRMALTRILPENDYRYVEEWQKINTSVATLCGETMKPAAATKDNATGIVPVQKTEQKHVDNDCEQFEFGGRRYTQCVGAQNKGLPYSGN